MAYANTWGGDTHYVVPPETIGVTPTPPYTNGWAYAATNIQDAAAQTVSGDTVLVTNGTYYSTNAVLDGSMINLGNKALTLRSINGPDVTIVDGNYPARTNRCLVSGTASVMIDGFTFRNGRLAVSGNGGGIQIGSGGGLVTNCVISTNVTEPTAGASGFGGGVSLGNNTSLRNCILVNNYAGNSGGGAYSWASNVLISGCVFVSNTVSAGKNGGGFYDRGGADVRVLDCTFRGNVGTYGGGVRAITAVISNCLFVSNVSTGGQNWGGGVNGGGLVTHCTFLSNSIASGARGGAVYGATCVRNCLMAYNQSPGAGAAMTCAIVENCTIVSNADYGASTFLAGSSLTNCIVYGNSVKDLATSVSVAYCLYGTTSTSGAITNCITGQAPGFMDSAGGNFRLLKASPCINAGTNLDWMAAATDLDGNRRVVRDTVDMGAYEFPPPKGTVIMLR